MRLFAALAAGLWLALPLPAQAAQTAVTTAVPAVAADGAAYPPVMEAKLKNGMTVLVLERKTSPTVAFRVYFRVGNVNNPAGFTGMAHLFEHMIFKGTRTIGTKNYAAEKPLIDELDKVSAEINAENCKPAPDALKLAALDKKLKDIETKEAAFIIPNEFQKIYDGLGGRGLNAATSEDYTMYQISLPANKVEDWMLIESDRFKNPVLREFYKERSVVLEEMRMGQSRQTTVMWQTLAALSFFAHPYHSPTIGWESDVSRLLRPELEEYFKTYYGPNNATVAIVGDVDAKKVVGMMEKYFGGIPARPLPQVRLTEEPEQKGERRAAIVFDAQPAVYAGYHVPAHDSADQPALEMISSMLSSGRTARFYKNIVEGKQLAVSAFAGYGDPGERFPCMFVLGAVPKAPHTVTEVENAMYEELEKLKTQPVDNAELSKVLKKYQASLLSEMESNEGLASSLAYNQQILGDWRYNWTALSDLAKVTPQDIQRVAAKYFVRDNRTVVWTESAPKPAVKEAVK